MPRAGSSLSWNTTTSWEKTDGERAPGGEEPAPGGTAEEAATGAPPPAATGAAAASSHRRPLDTQSSVSSYGASFCYIRTEPDEEVELQTSERVPRNRARAAIEAMAQEEAELAAATGAEPLAQPPAPLTEGVLAVLPDEDGKKGERGGEGWGEGRGS